IADNKMIFLTGKPVISHGLLISIETVNIHVTLQHGSNMYNIATSLVYQMFGSGVSGFPVIYKYIDCVLVLRHTVKEYNRQAPVEEFIEMVQLLGIVGQRNQEPVHPAMEESVCTFPFFFFRF